jgi:hypothetical protein
MPRRRPVGAINVSVSDLDANEVPPKTFLCVLESLRAIRCVTLEFGNFGRNRWGVGFLVPARIENGISV